jgi:hypothetical protein
MTVCSWPAGQLTVNLLISNGCVYWNKCMTQAGHRANNADGEVK